jgi:predicted glycosyltransferase
MIWIDLDNSPHVPLFRPILVEFERRGIRTFVTARAHAQTKDLLELWSMHYSLVGIHGGRSPFRKISNLMHRTVSLATLVRGKRIALSISHGSRSHLVASRLLRIPYLMMADYEYTEKTLSNLLADYILVPNVIPESRLIAAGYKMRKVIRYRGFKEEIYLNNFVPLESFRSTLNIDTRSVLVTLRPPSVTANYHDIESERLYRRCLSRFSSYPSVICLIANRTSSELALIPHGIRSRNNVRVLDHTVDGLQLLWNSDLVVSGGGTMNREAALLGVPTYSIFTGRKPYLDEYLQDQGRLKFIDSYDQIERIPLRKRSIKLRYRPQNEGLVQSLVDLILDIRKRYNRLGEFESIASTH